MVLCASTGQLQLTSYCTIELLVQNTVGKYYTVEQHLLLYYGTRSGTSMNKNNKYYIVHSELLTDLLASTTSSTLLLFLSQKHTLPSFQPVGLQ